MNFITSIIVVIPFIYGIFIGAASKQVETFEKRSILFKAKKGENFNHRNTLSILRIKI